MPRTHPHACAPSPMHPTTTTRARKWCRTNQQYLINALAIGIAIGQLAMFANWQAHFAPLRELVGQCHAAQDVIGSEGVNGTAAYANLCAVTWFDLGALFRPHSDGPTAYRVHPAGALAARNWAHTMFTASALWFVFVSVPRHVVALSLRVSVLTFVLATQPIWLMRSLEAARAEPPFGDSADSLRVLFPAAYADLDGLELPLDPVLLTAVFLANAIAAAHPSALAALLCAAQIVLAIVYAVVMRRVSVPSMGLTLLMSCALTPGGPRLPTIEDLSSDPVKSQRSHPKRVQFATDHTGVHTIGEPLSDDDNDGDDDGNDTVEEFNAEY